MNMHATLPAPRKQSAPSVGQIKTALDNLQVTRRDGRCFLESLKKSEDQMLAWKETVQEWHTSILQACGVETHNGLKFASDNAPMALRKKFNDARVVLNQAGINRVVLALEAKYGLKFVQAETTGRSGKVTSAVRTLTAQAKALLDLIS